MKTVYAFIIGASLATALFARATAGLGLFPFDIMRTVALGGCLVCALAVVLYVYAGGITHPSLKGK